MNLYFIQSCYERGTIKIGIAHDPYKRLGKLQTGNPRRLKLIGYYETEDARGLERQCHLHFKHVRGEWYQATDELLNFISFLRTGRFGGRRDFDTTLLVGCDVAERWPGRWVDA